MPNIPQTGPKKKLLWIEDDALLSAFITKELSGSGFDFIIAKDGEDALMLLKGIMPDLVMVDLVLPGKVDGFGVLKAMSTDPRLKSIPKIVLSNLSDKQDTERAKKLGADKFMVKADVSLAAILNEVRLQIAH